MEKSGAIISPTDRKLLNNVKESLEKTRLNPQSSKIEQALIEAAQVK
jgi:hypothetical protein